MSTRSFRVVFTKQNKKIFSSGQVVGHTSQNVPLKIVGGSVGCIHTWQILVSAPVYRKKVMYFFFSGKKKNFVEELWRQHRRFFLEEKMHAVWPCSCEAT